MSSAPGLFLNGYYDDQGNWRRTKICMTQCPANRCDCQPPGEYYYNPVYDQRLTQPTKPNEKHS